MSASWKIGNDESSFTSVMQKMANRIVIIIGLLDISVGNKNKYDNVSALFPLLLKWI